MARTELQVLLNEPVTVVIGTKAKPIRVTLREPVNEELGEYLALIGVALQKFLADNRGLISAAFDGDAKGIAGTKFDISALPLAFQSITAKIVRDGTGKPFTEKDVQKTLSIRQQEALIVSFGDVVGWQYIKETFSRTMRTWKGLTPPNANEEAPSWSTVSSSTSPAPSRTSRPKSSGGNARTAK